MPDLLTLEDFLPHLHTTFTARLPGIEPVPLELAGAESLARPNRAPAGRQPFSLRFLGPVSPHYLGQATVPLEHAAMGALALFLVPIGPLDGRMQYQAIFN
jgi:hypothetical protein